MRYIVVGGGPSGFACAQALGKTGARVIVLEREPEWGGCHAVTRKGGLFAEHGPRVYASNYSTFFQLLADAGVTFDTKAYSHSVTNSMVHLLATMTWSELFAWSKAAVLFAFGADFGRETVAGFAKRHAFSKRAIRRLHQLCSTIDGADAARFRLGTLLTVVNQTMGYTFLEPVLANDRGLWQEWRDALHSKYGVEFVTRTHVTRLIPNDSSEVVELVVGGERPNFLLAPDDRIILALPPRSVASLLPSSSAFAETHSYDTYLPVTFHWDARFQIDAAWSGAKPTDWGVNFIVMSDYLEDEPTKTIVQACAAWIDRPSTASGRTANETSDVDALVAEIWRQTGLASRVPTPPQFAILSPRVTYEQGRWLNRDTAYFATSSEAFPIRSEFTNVFVVGVQNRLGWYDATSMEAAVANALGALPTVYGAKPTLRPRASMSLTQACTVVVVTLLLAAILCLVAKKQK